jgi:hypothetical protein
VQAAAVAPQTIGRIGGLAHQHHIVLGLVATRSASQKSMLGAMAWSSRYPSISNSRSQNSGVDEVGPRPGLSVLSDGR